MHSYERFRKNLSYRVKAKPLHIGKTQDDNTLSLDPKIRDTGLHIVGLSRTGKTNCIENLVRQEIENDQGLLYIDPHGHSYQEMLKWCATRGFYGRKKIILLDPKSDDWAFGFNPLYFGDIEEKDFSQCVDYMVNASAQVWGGEDTNKTPRLRLFFSCMVFLLVTKKLSLREMMFLLTEGKRDVFRYLIHDIKDESFRPVLDDIANMKDKQFKEDVASTLNRVFELVKHPRIRSIVGQTRNVIDFRKIMDEGWIVLVNLSSGHGLTPDAARHLGTLIINDLFQKVRMRPKGSRVFNLYIDEAHKFLNDDVEDIINEAGKFGLNLVLSHHNLGQLVEAGFGIQKAILGIPNKIIFRTEFEDAKELAFRSFVFDLEEAKKSLIKPAVVGQEIIELEGSSDTVGLSRGETITESPGSETTGEVESSTVNEDGEIISNTTTTSTTTNTPLGPTISHKEDHSKAFTKSKQQALASNFKDLPTTVHTLEEQAYKAATRIVGMPAGKAMVKILGKKVEEFVSIPLMKSGYACEERVLEFEEKIKNSLPFFNRLDDVEKETENRHKLLEEKAKNFHNSQDDPEEIIDLE